jgi:hypothetical protein
MGGTSSERRISHRPVAEPNRRSLYDDAPARIVIAQKMNVMTIDLGSSSNLKTTCRLSPYSKAPGSSSKRSIANEVLTEHQAAKYAVGKELRSKPWATTNVFSASRFQ